MASLHYLNFQVSTHPVFLVFWSLKIVSFLGYYFVNELAIINEISEIMIHK